MWLWLFLSVYACEDPCPNVQRGRDFAEVALSNWKADSSISPYWKGHASYHGIDGNSYYISLVSDLNKVLVGRGDCELSKINWAFFNWEDVTQNEFEKIAFYESYYGVSPINSMRKAILSEKEIIYLFNFSSSGKEWLFRIYKREGNESFDSIGGAYAWQLKEISN